MKLTLFLIFLVWSAMGQVITAPPTTTARFGWSPSPSTNVTGYQFAYGTNSSNYTIFVSFSTNMGTFVSPAVVPGLNYGMTYYGNVRATNAITNSPWANEIVFVTPIFSLLPATGLMEFPAITGQ